MNAYDLDVLVIGGGGSGGFTAATTAMKNGARVGMVEHGRLGGLCILAGCMPSKTLLHGAAQVKELGVPGKAAYPRLAAFKRAVVDHLASGRAQTVADKEKAGLKLYRGRARFVDPHTVEVDGRLISAAAVVLATGSREMVPPLPGLEAAGFLTAEGFMDLTDLPHSLAVLGGGAIALELAQFAARMGVATTLIQRGQDLLSGEDPRVGALLRRALEDDGVTVFTGTELKEVSRDPEGRTVRFSHQGQPRAVAAQQVLLAMGRRPNIEGLDLAAAGVEVRGGAPLVDRFLRASAPHIFAAGDVTGVMMVVNLAVAQGEVAGHNASRPDEPRAMDDRVMPRAVFTDPQFASVGLNAVRARAAGLDFLEADYDLGSMGVARTYTQEVRGLMTMRAERGNGRVIGADLVAPEASLMIHDVAVAMKLHGTAQDLAGIPYIHPSLAEVTNFTAGRLAKDLSRTRRG